MTLDRLDRVGPSGRRRPGAGGGAPVPDPATPRRAVPDAGRLVPALAAMALLVLWPQPAPTQPARPPPPPAAEAERAAAQREAAAAAAQRAAAAEAAARDAAAEERRLAEQRVALARRVQAAERQVGEAEARAAAARAAADRTQAEAAARAAALGPLLPVMHRLALWPAESLLAAPAPPEAALQGLLVLQGISRRLAEEAAALRAAEAEARRRAAALAAEGQALAAAEAASRAAVAALDAALQAARQRRAGAADAAEAAARQAAESAARAATLQEALARLERERARREAAEAREAARRAAEEAREAARREAAEAGERAGRPVASARDRPAAPRQAEPARAAPEAAGDRAVPVAGPLLRGFGAAGEDGLPSRGLTWQAAGGARVVSPCAGRIAFASAFRSYGLLLIVDCGGAHHFVLAGLERLDVAAGQRVLAGEPVGRLGAGRPTLYGELRRQGRPVDPRPWLAERG